jgi:hypothetical protein
MKDPLDLRHPPAIAPDRVYGLLEQASRGCKIFAALRAALGRNLFQHLGTPKPTDRLARETGLGPRLLEPLCGLLAQAGFLEHDPQGWALPEDVRTYLAEDGPLSQRAVVDNLAETFRVWERLDRILDTGPVDPMKEGLFGGAFLPALAAETLSGEAQRTAALVAGVPGFGEVRDLLDLGGGHGLYALALCARLPGLRAEIMDTKWARPVAEQFMAGQGHGRARFIEGDIFTSPLGQGRDAALLFYNPGGKRADMLERIHACLRPGGFLASKHVFYARDDEGKDPLSDLEWNLTAFPGVSKGPHVYRFEGDLDQEEYMALLESKFDILADHGPEAFAAPALGKFGDRLDSRLIVAQKR